MNEKKFEKINKPSCPVRTTLDRIGGKWSFAIIYALLKGTKRFMELERSIEGINTRMLVKELKSLEEWGIVKRQAYATVPPTVEYSLTDKGMALQPVLHEVQNWAVKYV
jgi:DNA-binding HxlR family transcriptional regulator